MPPRKSKILEPVAEPIEPVALIEPIAPVKKTRKVKVKTVEPATPAIPAEPVVEKAPKKTSKWLAALKQYNEGKGRYSIPKKDTDEYNQVRALMANLSV